MKEIIKEIYKEVKAQLSELFVPVITGVGAFVWIEFIQYATDTINRGYLDSFGISSKISIVTPLTHSKLMVTFFMIMLITFCISSLNYSTNKIIKKFKKDKHAFIKMLFFSFIAYLLVIAFSIILSSSFIFLSMIKNIKMLYLLLKSIIFNPLLILMVVLFAFSECYLKSDQFKKSITTQKKDNKIKNNKNINFNESKSKQLVNMILNNHKTISLTLLLLFFIPLVDMIFYTFGNIYYQLEVNYPVYTDENNKKYQVVAQVEDGTYLVIEKIENKKQSTDENKNSKKYKIINLEDKELSDCININYSDNTQQTTEEKPVNKRNNICRCYIIQS